jgi:hypothetical protein
MSGEFMRANKSLQADQGKLARQLAFAAELSC